MGTVQFTARVKESGLLELPEEARELGFTPGEEVRVSLDRARAEHVGDSDENGHVTPDRIIATARDTVRRDLARLE